MNIITAYGGFYTGTIQLLHMPISRNDLIQKGDSRRILYDSLSVLLASVGLFATFTWRLGPDLGPQYLDTSLVQGVIILLLAMVLMVSASDQQ